MYFCKEFLKICGLVAVVSLAVVGFILMYDIDQMVLRTGDQINSVVKHIDVTVDVANQAMTEQAKYFRQEQEFLNSKEISQSLALGARSLRNLDKASIGLSFATSSLSRTVQIVESATPSILAHLDGSIVQTGSGIDTISKQTALDLQSLNMQLVSTGEQLRSQLGLLSPVLVDLDSSVQGLNELIVDPNIKTVLSESAGTMAELHGTAANLQQLTKPQNLALQAGIALFKFTGMKWLTGWLHP